MTELKKCEWNYIIKKTNQESDIRRIFTES